MGFIQGGDLAAKVGTAGNDGVEHAWHLGVDPEQRLATDDPVRVQLAPRRADYGELVRGLENHVADRFTAPRGLAGEFAIGGGATGGVPDHPAIRGEFVHGNMPAFGRRLEDHAPGARAGLSQRHEACPHAVRAAGGALARAKIGARLPPGVARQVQRHRLDRHPLERDIQFVGDEHRERGRYALAHLSDVAADRHRAVRLDANEGADLAHEAGRGAGRLRAGEHQQGAGPGRGLKQAAPGRRRARRAHAARGFMSSAARRTAARMRV